MSTTLSRLEAWRPDDLLDAADRTRAARNLVEDTGALLGQALAQVPSVWQGSAATAATDTLTSHLSDAEACLPSLDQVSRALGACAEALQAAQRTARQARQLADDHGLVLSDTGSCAPPPPQLLPADASDAARDLATRRYRTASFAADEAQALARQALAAADEADDDTARALRDAAVPGLTYRLVPVDLVGAITRRALPAIGSDPAEVAAWWATLSTAAQEALITAHPDRIGNLDGLPAAVRDRANRLRLTAETTAAQEAVAAAEATIAALHERLAGATSRADLELVGRLLQEAQNALGTARSRVAMLEAVRAELVKRPRAQLYLFDPTMPGHAAIAVGDIDTADHVAVLVPGTTAYVTDYLGGLVDDADRLRTAATNSLERNDSTETFAALAWIGYTAPDWDLSVLSTARATAGAQALDRTMRGLHSLRASTGTDPHLTVVGHSYGSLVAGQAARTSTVVDDLALLGSPGIGVRSAAELAVPAGHVYVAEAHADRVADLGWFGPDVQQPGFGATAMQTDGGPHPLTPEETVRSTGHSEYYHPDTESLWNLVAVATGRSDAVTTGTDTDAGDVLVGFPVLWFGAQTGLAGAVVRTP